jgi:hypothetical protein
VVGAALRDARAGLSSIASELEERHDGLVDLVGRPPAAELPPPRLLGAFEPLLLGWRSREPILPEKAARLVVAGGIFRPFGLVEGRAAATWSLRDGEVVLEPFRRLTRAHSEALTADARDVTRFLGS